MMADVLNGLLHSEAVYALDIATAYFNDRKFICPCYRHEWDIAETGHCICYLFVSEAYQPVELDDIPILEEGSPWPRIVV